MSRLAGPVTLLMVLALLLILAQPAGAVTGVDPVNAINPLLFEDAFLGPHGDPPHPTSLPNATGNGWVDTLNGGTIEIRADCGASPSATPSVLLPCLFVGDPTTGESTGTSSRNITHTDEFTWGFYVRVESYISIGASRFMAVLASSDDTLMSGDYFGLLVANDGSARIARASGSTDSGKDLALDIYYHFLFVVDGVNFEAFMNETDSVVLESLGSYSIAGAWAGFTKWNMEISTGAVGRIKATELAVGLPKILTEPIVEGTALLPYNYFMQTNSSLVGVTQSRLLSDPGFLEGVEESFFHSPSGEQRYGLRVTSVTGPPEGVFDVNLSTSNSAGTRWQNYTLTIGPVEIGEVGSTWLRTFGPAWVVFLAFVAIFVFIGLTLWRGAKGTLRRR